MEFQISRIQAACMVHGRLQEAGSFAKGKFVAFSNFRFGVLEFQFQVVFNIVIHIFLFGEIEASKIRIIFVSTCV